MSAKSRTHGEECKASCQIRELGLKSDADEVMEVEGKMRIRLASKLSSTNCEHVALTNMAENFPLDTSKWVLGLA
jgi:hypothetical protein